MQTKTRINRKDDRLFIAFDGELTLYTIAEIEKELSVIKTYSFTSLEIDCTPVTFLDTAGALFIYDLEQYFIKKDIKPI